MAKLKNLYFSLEDSKFLEDVIHGIPPLEALIIVGDEKYALRLPNGKLIANDGNYKVSQRASEGTKNTETYFGSMVTVTLPNNEECKCLEVSFEVLYNYCNGNKEFVPAARQMFDCLARLIKTNAA